jgi:uncharacterized membrane protein YdjX (TVP38/TMEM64 family)
MQTSSSSRKKSPQRARGRSDKPTGRGAWRRTVWGRWLGEHWKTLLIAIILVGVVSVMWGRVDFEAIHANAQRIPAGWAFLLIVVLPLLGCPATVVNVGAGLRFGVGAGLPILLVAIALQQLLAFGIVRLLPGVFTKLVAPIRKRLPQGSHRSVTIFSALLPGVPYWMQIYALPLIGVPLRTALLCSVPLHTVRSLLALVGAGVSDNLTVGWVVGLVVYAVALMLTCAWAGRRLQRQLRGRQSRRGVRAKEEMVLGGAGK